MPTVGRLVLPTVALAIAPATALAQSAARIDDATLVRRIDAYVAPLAARELSGTLLVARGGRVLVERSFGFANHELRVPFVPTTPTNVASITKPLTLIIAMRLLDEHRFSPGDTVARWLPEYVHGKRMTVTQLMNHAAGVPHQLLPDDAQEEPRTTTDMVLAANALPLLFDPGSRSSYSSGGYSLFAAVLERASGKSYDALLQEYVAGPVHARTIRHVDHRELLPGRATSVVPVGTSVINAPLRDLSFLVGAGSVYTTPRDVFAVMQGLIGGAYGATARGALVRATGLSWNGVTNGFRAFADWRASDSLSVLYFGNSHVGAIDLMRRDIPRIAAGERVQAPVVPPFTPVALSTAQRERLAGDYDTGGGQLSSVSFLSPSLMLFGDRALLATSDSTFFSTADYAPVTFVGASSGPVTAIQWGPGTWGTGEPGPRFERARGTATKSP
ncbi:MAG TPA: serine hydrolase domain-containing protein [Gemmatimonadaceae bacterium]|nr:serine hydrolase domain-containing protein [Gemmatimonadaceae bacterium]